MLKKFCLLILSVAVLAGVTSCSKYEEGPSISFRSAKARATNTWKLESYTINGVEKVGLTEYRTQVQNWLGDGVYNVSYIDPASGISGRIDGTWDLVNSNKDVIITETNPITGAKNKATSYTILKLKNSSMWIRSSDLTIEAHLVSF